MTKNQIEYAKLQEQKRANRAGEALTSSYNTGTLAQKAAELTEAQRHNIALEGLEGLKHGETARHNTATEQAAMMQLGISQQQIDETKRSNLSREQETRRSNLAQEKETHRANVERESETFRSNVAKETEAMRSRQADTNLRKYANETARMNTGIQQQQANISQGQLEVAQRQAAVSEGKLSVERDKVDAEIEKILAEAGLRKLEAAYVDDENVREWINSIGSALKVGAETGKSIQDILKRSSGFASSIGSKLALALMKTIS